MELKTAVKVNVRKKLMSSSPPGEIGGGCYELFLLIMQKREMIVMLAIRDKNF